MMQQVSASLRRGDLTSIRVGVEPWAEVGGEGRRVAYGWTKEELSNRLSYIIPTFCFNENPTT